MLSCSMWFSVPSFWMGGGLESRRLGRVYGADGAVARHHPHRQLICVHQHILTVSIFTVRRIKYSYTNIYHSTRRDITEDISLHPTNSVLSRVFLQKLILAQIGMKFPSCFCTPNFHYRFHKAACNRFAV